MPTGNPPLIVRRPKSIAFHISTARLVTVLDVMSFVVCGAFFGLIAAILNGWWP